jgi:DNA-binding response OmpR family regulator
MEAHIISQEDLVSSIFEHQTNPPQRILLMEPDEDIRCLNAEVLMDSGYDVEAVKDGVIAWDDLQINTYDLLIINTSLPEKSGSVLLKKLSAARMSLPIILVSETTPTEESKPPLGLRIMARLHKPCTLAKLLETVGTVLRAQHGAGAEIAPQPFWQTRSSVDRFRL